MNFETVRIHFLSGVFVLLSSRNLAIMATWRNDFSFLLGGGGGKSNTRDVVASTPSFSFPASPQSWPQRASQSFNLGQNRWKICTPTLPTNQGWENGAFWLLRGFILEFGGDWGLLFHFILSKIVGSPAEIGHVILLCSLASLFGKREDPGDEVVVWCGGWRSVAVNFGRHIWIVYCRDKEVVQECDKIWLGKYKYLLLLLSNIKEKDKLSYNLTTAWAKWTS